MKRAWLKGRNTGIDDFVSTVIKRPKLAPDILNEKGEGREAEAAALPCRDEAFSSPTRCIKITVSRGLSSGKSWTYVSSGGHVSPAVDGIVLKIASCENTSKGNGMDQTAIQSDIMHIR